MNFLKKIFGSTDQVQQQNEPQTDSSVNQDNELDRSTPDEIQAESADTDEADINEEEVQEAEHERKYNFETLRDDGLRAMQIGHINYAAKCLSAALEYQEDFETSLNLSECYIRLHQGDRAIPILRQLQQHNPENPQLFTDAAVAAEQMQDWALMEENAQRALDIAPEDDNALFLLARCKFSQQEYAEAEQHLNLFLGGGNQLYWPSDGDDANAKMLGFRAWFRINGSSVSGAPVRRGMPAMLRIVATPTAINETAADSSSLQGGDRGRLILRNGQLVIIRNGQTFSLNGQKL